MLRRAMARILVYTDGGVGANENCVYMTLASLRQTVSCLPDPQQYTVQSTTADELLAGGWAESCRLLVMPGGQDLPYVDKLQGRGNRIIGDFVRNGGAYLGICAGGYYGASSISFAKGDHLLEVVGPRELGFFAGVAEGPTFPGFQYSCNAGARATGITITPEGVKTLGRFGRGMDAAGRSLSAFYNGGCHFLPEDSQSMGEGRKEQEGGKDSDLPAFTNSFSVLATYTPDEASSVTHDHWAIVACLVGSGRAILSGVHFEASPDALRACYHGDEHIDVLLPHLEVCEDQRRELFSSVVRYLLQEG